MGFPYQRITVLSTLASYVLVARYPHFHPLIRNPTYLGTFVQAFLLQVVAWAFYVVVLYPRYFSPLRHLPGPKDNSFFNGQWARIRKEPSGGPARDWVRTIPNDGLIRYLGLFNAERILVTSPKALSEVLTTNSYTFVKPSQVVTGIGRLLGFGVLLTEGDEHRFQRKNLMPAFAFRHIKDLFPIFWGKSCEAILSISETIASTAGTVPAGAPPLETESEKTLAPDQALIEVSGWASRATLDIIGVAGMGQDFHAIADPTTPLFQTYRKIFKPSKEAQILGLLNLFLPSWLVRSLPVKRNGEIEAAVKIIRGTCRELIRTKKAKLATNSLTDVDILSVALESGGFTEDNLIDQLMTFLAAGHETTASAMQWAIYMLCVHPDIQTRLRAEVRAHLPSPDDDKPVTSSDIDHMPYLSAFVSEILRYWPPVPITIREAAHATTIADVPIPAGTTVYIAPWATNRSPALWGDDADVFNPERWLNADGSVNANGGASSNYAFLTFLHGPRSCIGSAFARAEFACLLAAWVGRVEWTLWDRRLVDESRMEIKGGITARPHGGLWVRAKVLEGGEERSAQDCGMDHDA